MSDGSIPLFDGFQACGPSYPLQKLGEHLKNGFCEKTKGPWAKPFCTPKPKGLVITSVNDDYKALEFQFGGHHKNNKFLTDVRTAQIRERADIEKVYDLHYVKVSSSDEVFNAHGSPTALHFNDEINTSIKLPSDMFSTLKPNSKIVLRSCETGYGKELASNIANTFAKLAPTATIYAPTKPISNLKLDGDDFVLYDYYFPNMNLTYKIDDTNRSLAISENKGQHVLLDGYLEDFMKDESHIEKLSFVKGVKNSIALSHFSELDLC